MLRDQRVLEDLKNYALENCPSIIGYHEPTGEYLYLNQGVHKITGYHSTELVGKSPYDFLHPDDLDHVEKNSHQPALKGHRTESVKFRFRKKSGEFRWLESTVIPVKVEKEVEKLITITTDIHDHHLLKDQLSIQKEINDEISEIAAIGYWSFDVRNKEISWSEKIYEIHGIEPGTEIDYNKAINFYPPGTRLELEQAVEKAINKGISYDLKIPLINNIGQEIWVRTVGLPLIKRGKCIKIFGIFQDITEAVKAENERLSNIAAYLSTQNQHLKEFSQILSHDLRGPLSSLKMLFDELESDDNAELREVKPLIEDNLSQLFEKLNYLTRFTDRAIETRDMRCISIRSSVQKIAENNKSLLLDKEVVIREGRMDWDEVVYHQFKMDSILHNLIENAAYFSDPDKPERFIELSTVLKNNKHYLIIEDNGLGMNITTQRLKRKNRFHPDLSRKGEGLFLVQTLVEGSKGQLKMRSTPGMGTKAIVILDKFKNKEDSH